jgi:hypothetical protein
MQCASYGKIVSLDTNRVILEAGVSLFSLYRAKTGLFYLICGVGL